ncbi:Pectinesterase [Pseudopedobacter saltans DSM 12145]|uniref:Pectinesterase n=1 Tax=Pseudopedobacter saltans (strain ATCC 51119 / DSM 12145 / JCM 21818 / CCUG 39354 / LMG 10337 / NBRC 100064 / NCIMB 13643) TaxID=762903 RepID=F0SCP9_PSESL|nr:pectinesterase family protein [Pseudopedobacter saltans]ADY53893.1 Pectinesterase [Pseudopedobacter saltans DSM 12145]
MYKIKTLGLLLVLICNVSQLFANNYDFIVDGQGEGDFKTVQEAINAVPDFRKNPTLIFIKNGIYKEKLILPGSKKNVKLVGESAEHTVLTYDDYASKKNRFGEEMGTSGSSSFYIYGDGFVAENITFQNSSGPVGQAVAVQIIGDQIYFKNCRFLGFQDTLYTFGRGSRQLFDKCYIEGTTDFIFGSSTVFFRECEIFCKKGGSFITAASTPDTVKYGYVFKDCKITGEEGASYYLGRPWRPYAKTVFINCELGKHIKPAGWDFWGKESNKQTAFYAEYKNKGEGFKPKERVNWSHQLSNQEAKHYNISEVLGDWVAFAGK